MSWTVLLAVLAAALLHALWNALIKGGQDKPVDTALVHGLAAWVCVPAAWWLGAPAPQSWPYLAASVAIHLAYYAALAAAYEHGDISLTYPVMRGLAPAGVALASAAWLGEPISPLAMLGIGAVALGVLLVGLSAPRVGAAVALGSGAGAGSDGGAPQRRRALGFAVLNAAIIAAYTLMDARGVRLSGDVWRYVVWLFALDGVLYPAWVAWSRRGARWPAACAYARQRWPKALAGGVASIAAYAVALWAMTQAPVAHVAALRETSVLFAAALGAWWLKEGFGWPRWLGAAVVVLGVAVLRGVG